MRYEITETCPNQALIQHLESGDYDYSEFESASHAWDEHESDQGWVTEVVAEYGPEVIYRCRRVFFESLKEYTRQEIMESAQAGYDWPLELGFVVGTDDD